MIGILWVVGIGVGVSFISPPPGYAPDLFGYLFGNILTIPSSSLYLIGGATLAILLMIKIFYKEFLAISFDEEYVQVQGRPLILLYTLLLFMITLTIVLTIKFVGIMLIISMVTIPPAIAIQHTHHLKRMMILSSIFGILFTTLGLLMSYWFDVSSSAAIILISAAVYMVTTITKMIRPKKALL